MTQKPSSFDRVKSILMQEVNWAHIGFSKNNNKILKELYQFWAERYDEEMPTIDYNYTEPMKEAFLKSNIKTDSKILDAACGTGYPTMALYEMGYKNLHGIDFSSEMIQEAKKKNIYKSLTVADLINPIDFATDTFDVIMCVGFLASGHMGSEPLDEFIRVIKPGGHLICSIGVNIFDTDGFDKKLQQLQDDNIIQIDHVSEPFVVVPKAKFGSAKSKMWSLKIT
tara:strand:+ start:4843 stop:5517 length:675 start_codon:yes stop_codon:yes gene_type:complete